MKRKLTPVRVAKSLAVSGLIRLSVACPLLYAPLSLVLRLKRKNLWLHVGAPKTASTFLQRNLFPRHPQLSFVWFPWRPALDRKEVARVILAFARHFKSNWKRKTFLASGESLASNSYINPVPAKRLLGTFPDANVLYITRNETDHLHSLWLHHMRLDLFRINPLQPRRLPSADEFFALSSPNAASWTARSSYADVLNPMPLLKRLKDHGRRNIRVLPYEMFVNRPREYLDRLSQILGINPDITWQLYRNARSNNGVLIGRFGTIVHRDRVGLAISTRGLAFCRAFTAVLNRRDNFDSFLKGARNYAEELPPTIKRHFLRRLAKLKDEWNGDYAEAVFYLVRDEKFLQWLVKGEKVKPQFSAKTLAELRKIRAPQNRWMAKEFNLDLEKYGYAM